MVSNLKRRRRNIKQSIAILIFLILAAFAYHYYFVRMSHSQSVVQLTSPDNTEKVEFNVEVASSDSTRAKGLMFRKNLPTNSGMLFVYPGEQVLSFWMKNTNIPLDIVFANSKFEVVGTLENLTPHDTESKNIGKPSKYAIEINTGLVAEHGISSGWKMEWIK